MQGDHLKVVSYNVHSCLGWDRCSDPKRIAGIINSFDADVVALQEVATRYGVTGDMRQLNLLAQGTGLQAIPGPTLIRPDAPCGTAVLHRLRPGNVNRVDL
ncbi:MAG: hypothetical protein R3F37_12035, partial [Candidatus Competibacteraceae bacterium]